MKVKIVFTEPSSTSFFGKIVRWAIGGRFSHVHFLFIEKATRRKKEKIWTYEAFPPRVRFVPEDLYPGQGEAIELPLTQYQIKVMRDKAIIESQRKLYSANDAFRIFVRNRISKRFAQWLGKYLHADQGETCSTAGVDMLREMWPKFGGDDAFEFSPDELYQAVMEKQASGW